MSELEEEESSIGEAAHLRNMWEMSSEIHRRDDSSDDAIAQVCLHYDDAEDYEEVLWIPTRSTWALPVRRRRHA